MDTLWDHRKSCAKEEEEETQFVPPSPSQHLILTPAGKYYKQNVDSDFALYEVFVITPRGGGDGTTQLQLSMSCHLFGNREEKSNWTAP